MRRTDAYEELKRLILTGELRAGERLHERDLTDRLGVSRTPIREALTLLTSDGLVVNRAQRGHFVQGYDAGAVDDLYRLRAVLEKHAIQLAVARLTAEERQEFERIKTLLGQYSGRRGQSGKELRDSFLVHEMIAKASKDLFLSETLSRLYARLTLFVWLDALYDEAEVTRAEHAALIDTLLAGNAKKAAALMVKHVTRSRANVRRALQRRPALASVPLWGKVG